ncbi:hypothetical protein MAR_019947 [Mya arenaria]|uniref:C2H2-type domain-containing protein n=1 Tax=Mya arenaria TaxID=6604 RepID=A0ABY7E3M0_MYAAR|nr:hypothetical protein MAR_019947 [Mya arenaria]
MISYEQSTLIIKAKQEEALHTSGFPPGLINQLVAGFSRHKRSSFESRPRFVKAHENVDGHSNVRRSVKSSTCKYHSLLKQRKEMIYRCEICNIHLCKQANLQMSTLRKHNESREHTEGETIIKLRTNRATPVITRVKSNSDTDCPEPDPST